MILNLAVAFPVWLARFSLSEEEEEETPTASNSVAYTFLHISKQKAKQGEMMFPGQFRTRNLPSVLGWEFIFSDYAWAWHSSCSPFHSKRIRRSLPPGRWWRRQLPLEGMSCRGGCPSPLPASSFHPASTTCTHPHPNEGKKTPISC